MPDRDVYNRSVERGWRAAARLVYEADDDELTLASLARALGQTLKVGGCPGIDTIASIVAAAADSTDPGAVQQNVTARLEHVRRDSGDARTEVAVAAARRILVDPKALIRIQSNRLDRDRIELVVAQEILVTLAISKISSPRLTGALVEWGHMPFDLVRSRREHARELLVSAPQISKLAEEVLKRPDGQTIKTPQVKIIKPTQEELVRMAISL